jgi:hypothetical protein
MGKCLAARAFYCALATGSVGCFSMSLAEIKNAVAELTPQELAELAAFIQTHDGLAWDQEIERDFSPGGKHHGLLAEVDAAIDAGNATPLP